MDLGFDLVKSVGSSAAGSVAGAYMTGTLAAAGMSWDDVVVVQVFCSDVSHYDAFNEVYRSYFTKEFPARAFIGSGALLFDARFEVMVTAVKR